MPNLLEFLLQIYKLHFQNLPKKPVHPQTMNKIHKKSFFMWNLCMNTKTKAILNKINITKNTLEFLISINYFILNNSLNYIIFWPCWIFYHFLSSFLLFMVSYFLCSFVLILRSSPYIFPKSIKLELFLMSLNEKRMLLFYI